MNFRAIDCRSSHSKGKEGKAGPITPPSESNNDRKANHTLELPAEVPPQTNHCRQGSRTSDSIGAGRYGGAGGRAGGRAGGPGLGAAAGSALGVSSDGWQQKEMV